MRILILNDLVEHGGAEVQTFREAKLLRQQGHIVQVITLDPSFPLFYSAEHCNLPSTQNKLLRFLSRFFAFPGISRKLDQRIKRFMPDVIHINNSWNNCISVFSLVSHYPAVQTIHDFSIVCPIGTCVKPNGRECSGFAFNNCLSRCGCSILSFARYCGFISMNYHRRKSIGAFIAPSQALTSRANSNGFPTECLPNPIDVSFTRQRKIISPIQTYLYYGYISKMKGVPQLLEVWSTFSRQTSTSAQLLIAGHIDTSYEAEFRESLDNTQYVHYLGHLSVQEINDLYAQIYCVIVPSWIENYPNTVLEALSHNTLVIGSTRGGITELIPDARWLFDILSFDSFYACLERAAHISASEYQIVVEKGFTRVQVENSPALFTQRLVSLFNGMNATTKNRTGS